MYGDKSSGGGFANAQAGNKIATAGMVGETSTNIREQRREEKRKRKELKKLAKSKLSE